MSADLGRIGAVAVNASVDSASVQLAFGPTAVVAATSERDGFVLAVNREDGSLVALVRLTFGPRLEARLEQLEVRT